MSALNFPIQFKRQYNSPIDVDMVFSTTAERISYLTSERRYAGQLVADLQDGKLYKLDSTKAQWMDISLQGLQYFLPLSGGTVTGPLSSTATIFALGGNSVDWNSVYSSVRSTSANWDSVYTSSADSASVYSTVRSASATKWDNDLVNTYTHSNFLPLSGGTLTGKSTFNDNVTIFGDLSCTGTQTFSNTIFSTTSALSVVHIGSTGPALWVGNNGAGDIASFYDIDQGIEILHVGGNNSSYPNVGIKTSQPNKDFTVAGDISATGSYYGDGSKLTGIVSGDTEATTLVRANSAAWSASTDTTALLPLSGGTLTGNLTVNGDVVLGSDALDTLTFNGGPVNFPNATSTGDAIILGGDVNLYRSSADILRTSDTFLADGSIFTNGNFVIITNSSFPQYILRSDTSSNNRWGMWLSTPTTPTIGNPLVIGPQDTAGSGNGLLTLTRTSSSTGANGNVGINTSTPNERLTVSGNISATGNVYASNAVLTNATINTSFAVNNQLYYSTDSNTSRLSALSGAYDEGQFLGRTKLTQNNNRLTNVGNTWTAKDSSRNWYSVCMSSDGKYQTAVVYSGGQIYISSDYGNTWVAKDSSRSWYSVCMSSDGKYQTAVVYSGQIYISSDYGNTWTAKESSRHWYSVCMSSDGKYQTAVVFNGGQIYISSDYGNTWVAKDSSRSWYSVCMSSDGKYQTAVGSSTQIYISNDYGNTWVAKDSSRNWYSVCMSSDGKYQTAVVSNVGQIYISNDYGNTWVAKDSSRNWRSVCMSSDGKYQTAGVFNGGQIYISSDYGNTWTAKESSRHWSSVCMSSDGKYQTAVVFNGQIYTCVADEEITGNLNVLGTLSSTATIFASGGNSNLWNSVYSSVMSTSASWDSATSIINANYTTWNGMVFTVGDLYNNGRPNWNSVYSNVQANSATTWNYQGTDIKNLSSGWVGGNSVYSSVRPVSANWNSVYSNVQANSAKWVLEDFIVACSDESTNLTITTSAVTFRVPFAMYLNSIRASVNVAPVGSAIIVDVKQTGTSIFSTKPSIDANEDTSTTATTPAVISTPNLTDNAKVVVSIDQIGSSTPGRGLKLTFKGYRV